MTKTYREYLQDVENGIAPPAYIPTGGEDFCGVCGGNVTWPPTGEPAQGCCDNNCDDKIHEAWRKKTDPRYWHEVSRLLRAELIKAEQRVTELKTKLDVSDETAARLQRKEL